MSETFLCSMCGTEHPVSDRTIFEDQELCGNCLDEHTALCLRCGTRIWLEDSVAPRDTPLCESCYERHYTNCDSCGRIILLDDANYEGDDEDHPLCDTCYYRSSQDNQTIHDYYYKPAPIFYGDGPRFFGVELEVDVAGENTRNARKLLDIANRSNELLYIKHDGSLEDGMELVTHPLTLDYHCNHMPWVETLDCLKEMGYRSHQAGTCGLHVHVSRDAFGTTEAEQDLVIARILFFVEKHWEKLLKFSRRTQRQLQRWAARYGFKEHPKEILDHAKKGYGGGRYNCVNLQTDSTIEFRIFRGTLKLNTLIATLQLVDRICDVALFMSDDEIKSMSWTTFVSGCQQYPELVQYLRERQLYINDPVESEADL